jgi:hypothetical protein
MAGVCLPPGASVIIRRYGTWNAALDAAFSDHRRAHTGAPDSGPVAAPVNLR